MASHKNRGTLKRKRRASHTPWRSSRPARSPAVANQPALGGRCDARSLCAFRSARVLDLRQSDERQEADVDPADIELIPLGFEPRGVRIGVVVVMQFLATQPDRDR